MIPDWEKKLIYELALYRNKTPLHPLEETFRLFRVDRAYLERRLADDEFYRTMLSMQKELDEKGVPFKLKARVIVDQWLDPMDTLMLDPTAPATAKVALFQHLTALAGYASPKRSEGEGEQREAVVINLNLGPQQHSTGGQQHSTGGQQHSTGGQQHSTGGAQTEERIVTALEHRR